MKDKAWNGVEPAFVSEESHCLKVISEIISPQCVKDHQDRDESFLTVIITKTLNKNH